MNIESVIHLNKFKPREYQIPIMDALINKGYKRILAILPRRAGKDLTAFNICIRECLRKPMVIFYVFPTYSQAKKVIWDSITTDGLRILDYIPDEIVHGKNSQEMKIRFKNGSLLQLVGSDSYDCFDDQTEILTNDGWKLFKDITDKDRVASLVDGFLEFVKPLKRLEYDFDGMMYKIFNNSIDMLVTPNHRFYVKSSKGVYKFKEISDATIRHDSIPSKSGWEGTNILFERSNTRESTLHFSTEDYLFFLGLYISEGSSFKNNKCYRITISQTKTENRIKIKKLLARMKLNYVETKDGFNIENKELYNHLSVLGKQENRYIFKSVKNLSPLYLKILLDALIMGDGHTCSIYTAYYSTSKKLIDDVQEIIIKLGLSGNIRIKKQSTAFIKGREIKSKKTLYQIIIRKSNFKRLSSSKKNYISQEYYKGKVYCVSVPSGVIKVRRNGKECWSGNSLMGTNPQGIVFSEYAMQDPRAYQYLRPILTVNDGWAIFISTPRGKNHLYELYEIARNSPDWFCYKLTVEDTQHVSEARLAKEREVMSEDLIQQEYYTSFNMGIEGSYYAKYIDKMRIKGQIGQVPWESAFKVNTAWDLGVRDSTSIIFFQTIGHTVRIIDYYENSKEGLEHYIQVLESKDYSYGRHIAPHDIKVREFGSGITRIEKARQLGIKFTVAEDISIVDGIEAVRSTLSKVWIDEVKASKLVDALENYRAEFDVKREVYNSKPLHNWASHAADCMRYLCISLPKVRDGMTGEDIDRRYSEAMYGPSSRMPAIFRDENEFGY
jgi:phage terminase large subunit